LGYCAEDLYYQEQGFRSQVIMAQHGFGRGEYKYFSYPLPPVIQVLRTAAYSRVVPVANQWHARMGKDVRFPHDHAAFLERCHQAGQAHDLYGEHVFSMQIAILLDQPREDFEGREFVMTEQHPRIQTRAMVLPLKKGDTAIFTVNSRPVKGGSRRLSGDAESLREQTLLG
jgi:hypothetical protein